MNHFWHWWKNEIYESQLKHLFSFGKDTVSSEPIDVGAKDKGKCVQGKWTFIVIGDAPTLKDKGKYKVTGDAPPLSFKGKSKSIGDAPLWT